MTDEQLDGEWKEAGPVVYSGVRLYILLTEPKNL